MLLRVWREIEKGQEGGDGAFGFYSVAVYVMMDVLPRSPTVGSGGDVMVLRLLLGGIKGLLAWQTPPPEHRGM